MSSFPVLSRQAELRNALPKSCVRIDDLSNERSENRRRLVRTIGRLRCAREAFELSVAARRDHSLVDAMIQGLSVPVLKEQPLREQDTARELAIMATGFERGAQPLREEAVRRLIPVRRERRPIVLDPEDDREELTVASAHPQALLDALVLVFAPPEEQRVRAGPIPPEDIRHFSGALPVIHSTALW